MAECPHPKKSVFHSKGRTQSEGKREAFETGSDIICKWRLYYLDISSILVPKSCKIQVLSRAFINRQKCFNGLEVDFFRSP